MLTPEERVAEVYRRAAVLQKKRQRRQYLLSCAGAVAACLALAVVTALVIANTPLKSPTAGTAGYTASIFAAQEYLGAIVVAILAFCLGAMVTVFCFRLRRHMEDEHDDRKP